MLEADFVRQSFSYTTGWVTLPTSGAGSTVQTTIAINADADFESVYLTAAVRQSALLVTTWSGLVQLTDPGAGRTLFNTAVPIDSIGGNGRQPYQFLPARIWRKASSIVVTFTQSVVTATDASITLHGNKLFKKGELQDPSNR